MLSPDTNELTITWTIDDIYESCPEYNLTDVELRKVLHTLNHNYDEYFGINWVVINKAVDKVVAARRVKADMSTFNKKASSTPAPLTQKETKDFEAVEKWLGI